MLGDFNEWMRGLTTTLLSAKLKSVDLQNFLKRRRTYPGLFPILHLDHIYYAGQLEVVGIELSSDQAVARRLGPLTADRRRADRPLILKSFATKDTMDTKAGPN